MLEVVFFFFFIHKPEKTLYSMMLKATAAQESKYFISRCLTNETEQTHSYKRTYNQTAMPHSRGVNCLQGI